MRHEPTPPEPGHRPPSASPGPARATRVADAIPRRPLAVHGVVTAVTVREAAGPVLDATLDDGTGVVELTFFGRRSVPGIVPGASVAAEGVALLAHGHLTLLNPRYRFTT